MRDPPDGCPVARQTFRAVNAVTGRICAKPEGKVERLREQEMATLIEKKCRARESLERVTKRLVLFTLGDIDDGGE